MYRHVFFDLDHTLWDFEKNSRDTMFTLFEKMKLRDRVGCDFDPFYEVYRTHNDRLWARFRKGYISRQDLRWKRMWHTLLHFRVGDTKIANELSLAYLELLPTQRGLIADAADVVHYCAGKYDLHIITNGFETTQRQKLQYCGLATYFSHIVTSEKSNSIKPQREIFEYAQQISGASPDTCIMIGDALDIDIAGAHNAGWDAIYFNPDAVAHNVPVKYEVRRLQAICDIL